MAEAKWTVGVDEGVYADGEREERGSRFERGEEIAQDLTPASRIWLVSNWDHKSETTAQISHRFNAVYKRNTISPDMGSDEEGKALATAEFWNSRYGKADGDNPTHEWFRSYAALKPFFQTHLFHQKPPESNPRIVHLGSGDSTIPQDLAAAGYKNQLCLDFSQVVVDLMSSRHASEPGIEWRWADVRDMKDIPSSSVDVAFDKGTMDAMIHGSPWSPPDDVLDNTGRYIDEVHRVLKEDGIFLYVTYRQPHFIKPLLNRNGIWSLHMEYLTDDKSSFEYHGFVLSKRLSVSDDANT